MLHDLHTRWQTQAHTLVQLQNIASDVDNAIDILRAGAIRSVVSQATITEADEPPTTQTSKNMPPEKLRPYITERLELLAFLQRKIEALHHFHP